MSRNAYLLFNKLEQLKTEVVLAYDLIFYHFFRKKSTEPFQKYSHLTF